VSIQNAIECAGATNARIAGGISFISAVLRQRRSQDSCSSRSHWHPH
jgi:hypothetical protein